MFGYNPYGYGLLSQMPMQQAPQIVQQPILSAARGIGTSLPDYREMSAQNFMANLFESVARQNTYRGLLSSLMPAIAAGTASGAMPLTYHGDPAEVQQIINQRIRHMSPEEYERFAVYG